MRSVLGVAAGILLAAGVTAQAADLTPGEKNLVRQGYRLEVRNGQKLFCRSEGTLGSRLHEHKVCGTEEAIAHRAEANNDNVRDSLKKSVMNGAAGK